MANRRFTIEDLQADWTICPVTISILLHVAIIYLVATNPL